MKTFTNRLITGRCEGKGTDWSSERLLCEHSRYFKRIFTEFDESQGNRKSPYGTCCIGGATSSFPRAVGRALSWNSVFFSVSVYSDEIFLFLEKSLHFLFQSTHLSMQFEPGCTVHQYCNIVT